MSTATANQLLVVGPDASRSPALALVPEWSALLGTPLEVLPLEVAGAGDAGLAFSAGIVEHLLADPQVAGAVILGHRSEIYAAAESQCVFIARDAQELRECNVLAKGAHGLSAHATEVSAIGAALEDIWPLCGAPVVCLGAGGTGAALCLHLLRRERRPRRITMCETDLERAEWFDKRFGALPPPADVELVVEVAGADTWADIVAQQPPGALVVNATGLGPTRMESPLPSHSRFPANATVWDLVHLGPPPFLGQAQTQAGALGLKVYDGQRLFSLSWLAALSALLGERHDATVTEQFIKIAEDLG